MELLIDGSLFKVSKVIHGLQPDSAGEYVDSRGVILLSEVTKQNAVYIRKLLGDARHED
jgi:hypothetical protein